MLRRHRSIEGIDAELRGRTTAEPDQWQVQVLLQVLRRGRVLLHSKLDDDTVLACGLTPVADIGKTLEAHLRTLGPDTHVAVLPDGPQTIPYADDAVSA
jgi:nickel-dependent lactate racemase